MTTYLASPVHLCIVQPAGYVHSMGLLDAALYFRHQFRQIGVNATMGKNRLRRDATNLVFGAHLGFDATLLHTFCCVFVNLEQLGDGGSQLPASYLNLLRNCRVIDYDADNPAAYGQRAEDVALISFGYAPYLGPVACAPPLDQRPFDLLFFGSLNARRRQLIERIEQTGRTVVTFDAPVYGPERDAFIIQARAVLNCHFYDTALFEQVRSFQVLSLGTPVVSERTERTRPGAAFEDSVSWFSTATLEQFFTHEYPQAEFLTRAQRQLSAFQCCDPRAQYAHALHLALRELGAFRGAGQTVPEPQRRMHIGAAKDYRPGWLNVDPLEADQSDIAVDLARPQVWPASFPSPFWGTVQLRPGATDLIAADDVVARVSDLSALMSNCLALLRVGGLMVVEVAHAASLAAPRDPTHARALDAHSWICYTDGFWQLGWFEYRFKIRQVRWLDAKLAPCDRSAASFMSVTLEKVPTTIAERMTARTMRPDFAGLLEALPYAPHPTSLPLAATAPAATSRIALPSDAGTRDAQSADANIGT